VLSVGCEVVSVRPAIINGHFCGHLQGQFHGPMDIPVDTRGQSWTLVDSRGQSWTLMDNRGRRRAVIVHNNWANNKTIPQKMERFRQHGLRNLSPAMLQHHQNITSAAGQPTDRRG
jgi:hypothetical protein